MVGMRWLGSVVVKVPSGNQSSGGQIPEPQICQSDKQGLGLTLLPVSQQPGHSLPGRPGLPNIEGHSASL